MGFKMKMTTIELTQAELAAVMRGCISRAGESKAMDSAFDKLTRVWVQLMPKQKWRRCGCRSAGHELCG